MTIDQVSVFVENAPGKLAGLTRILAEANVDIRAMSLADNTEYGILRMIVNDTAAALKALERNDCIVSVTQVLAVEINDRPGSLSQVLGVLEKEGISVEYLYAFITRKADDAYVIFRIEDTDRANVVLAENGIRTASPHDLYDL
ncbi:MAG: ACT domain-containing protein [Clostridiales Family XIII bacterium]|jgi:hypothetical protein|nr:ACT domain-containing protein [Clostridiales Family XIII bacterium]